MLLIRQDPASGRVVVERPEGTSVLGVFWNSERGVGFGTREDGEEPQPALMIETALAFEACAGTDEVVSLIKAASDTTAKICAQAVRGELAIWAGHSALTFMATVKEASRPYLQPPAGA